MYSTNCILKYDAILALPKHDEHGNLFTVIIGTNGPVEVELGPTALIDFNLRYYGSSLQGARDGARFILGEGKMYPIVMNERLDLYWLPSKSPSQEDCIWFALHHIDGYIGIGKKETRVRFSNGSTIIVEMSEYVFDKRVQKAYKLKGQTERRTKENLWRVSESAGHYHIAKKDNAINYEVTAQYKR